MNNFLKGVIPCLQNLLLQMSKRVLYIGFIIGYFFSSCEKDIPLSNGTTFTDGNGPSPYYLAIPDGFEVQVRPRSGLALKHGITLANSPGTIDSDYRGPLGVIMYNSGEQAFQIAHGDRIAQMVLAPVVQAAFTLVAKLDETTRGAGGFGSTGQR